MKGKNRIIKDEGKSSKIKLCDVVNKMQRNVNKIISQHISEYYL